MRNALAALLVSAVAATASADPVSFGFFRISSNSSTNIASQLEVIVDDWIVDGESNGVCFEFLNHVGVDSSITDVYFDDGTLLDLSEVEGSTGVLFSVPANPADLPGAQNIGFTVTQAWSADADAGQGGVMAHGVNASTEWLKVYFTLQNGQTYQDTIRALRDGSLRIGIHAQSIGNDGESDGFANLLIPVPGASLLGALGLAVAGFVMRRTS